MADWLQPLVDRGLLAGAVTLVATKDRILNLEAIGYSDLAARKPMTTDTLFWIASMTKPMTCTALMTLVDEGKVNVDDPVEKYLPEFKGQMVIAEKDDDHVLLKKPDHPILVREVMNHTSGLSFASPIETPTYDRLLLEHMVRSYATMPLLFEPGTQYLYSNSGTNTAGRIVEVISGMSYEAFMQERFFTPLGMKDTTFWPNEEQLSRLSKVYRANPEKTALVESTLTQLSHPLTDPKRRCLPAGGLFSTATDCLEFCRILLCGGNYKGRHYLSENAIQQMTTKQTAPSVEKCYGFGYETHDGRYGHGGAYKTHMAIHPAHGMITVFLLHHCADWSHPDGDTIHPQFFAAAAKLVAAAA